MSKGLGCCADDKMSAGKFIPLGNCRWCLDSFLEVPVLPVRSSQPELVRLSVSFAVSL